MEEGGGTLCRGHTERQVAASRATCTRAYIELGGGGCHAPGEWGILWQTVAGGWIRMLIEWLKKGCGVGTSVSLSILGRPTRLNAGSLLLFLELAVKRGLGQPYPNLVGNWSRSPEEPAAGQNQRIVPVRKAGLRGEAPHGPPEQCWSSEPVTPVCV
ncbi:hypothetical protein HAX54_014253 [Datura stramonium]|uniref:Uncharacterized protein n=1 Tax=Datura stramonium TaxID=4076 RepID=A0ABS8TMW1_DATST|nr:hypothetical protein [Datura stramonium]